MSEDITPAKGIPSKATYQKPKIEKPTEFAKLTPGQEKEWCRERKLIRQVPKHEFLFPPPFSKLGSSFNEMSEWTNGLPSPSMSNSFGLPEPTPVIEFG
jgi:hypothetical protein